MNAIRQFKRVNRNLLFAALLVVMPNATLGTTFLPTIHVFELSRSENRTLDQVACRSLKRRLQASYGSDFDEDRKQYMARARCSPHRSIDGQPVVYERSCDRMEGWNCDSATEVILATFADRRVHVRTASPSLEETYAVVKHFVRRKLIEPGRLVDELDGGRSGLPLDECRVELGGRVSQYTLNCNSSGRREVLRIQSNGVVTFRQIPLPECATTDNPACVGEVD